MCDVVLYKYNFCLKCTSNVFFYRKNRVNIKIGAFSENSKTKKTRLV
jgi:hypothetical protein